jgi:hypothetical protein
MSGEDDKTNKEGMLRHADTFPAIVVPTAATIRAIPFVFTCARRGKSVSQV